MTIIFEFDEYRSFLLFSAKCTISFKTKMTVIFSNLMNHGHFGGVVKKWFSWCIMVILGYNGHFGNGHFGRKYQSFWWWTSGHFGHKSNDYFGLTTIILVKKKRSFSHWTTVILENHGHFGNNTKSWGWVSNKPVS